jgi:hypothetical protein
MKMSINGVPLDAWDQAPGARDIPDDVTVR